jgi:hypothetical protein
MIYYAILASQDWFTQLIHPLDNLVNVGINTSKFFEFAHIHMSNTLNLYTYTYIYAL